MICICGATKQTKEKSSPVWMGQFQGAVLPVRTDRSIEADIEQWDDCQQCPEFDSCYKLCLAKVTLESAVAPQ